MNELTMAGDAMRTAVRRTWWIPLIQGIAAVIIGLLLLMNPATTLVGLAIFLGAYWLVGGIFDIIGAFTRRSADRHWGWSLLGGIIAIIAGFLLLSQPLMGAVVLPFVMVILIAVSAIVSGIMNIIWAIRARNEIKGEGWLIVWGVISVILGIWLLTTPWMSAVALVWVGAVIAVVGGIALVIFSFRLRSAAR